MKIQNKHKYAAITLTTIVMLFCILFYSCDIIEAPYRKSDGGFVVTDTLKPKILLEEFTASRCQNCPAGARIAHSLENYYPDRFYVVAIHGGTNAVPYTTGDKYRYDFRTNMGREMYTTHNIDQFGTPSGKINRVSHQGSILIYPNFWQSAVIDFLENTSSAAVKIDIEANYSEASKVIEVIIDLDYRSPQITENKISVWILEDNIVNWQLDGAVDIPDYVHNNVLRYSFNGTWGEKVSETAIATGFQFNKTYSYILPQNSDWVPKNLKVIAFVYDDDNGVKQVEQVKLQVNN